MTDGCECGNGPLEGHGIVSKLAWAFVSETGNVRDSNEDFADAFVPTVPDDAWDRGPLFVVADGMGGHAAGEVASRVATGRALATWSNGSAPARQALRAAVRDANVAVYDAAFEPGRAGMGTTMTALTLAGHEALVAHVGDSRCYRVRAGAVAQLTVDHSRVADMVRMHLISPEQAADHPARSMLTRSLGADPAVQVDVTRHDLARGDVFVLCSDGLWDVVSSGELIELARGLGTPDLPTPVPVARRLVGRALERGARDNVTVIVVHVTSDLPIPAATGRRSLFRRGR